MPTKPIKRDFSHLVSAIWDGILLTFKAIYRTIEKLIHLLAGFVRLALLAIVGFAVAIFLFTLSLFFLTRAFTLTEDSEWAELRHKTIQIIDTELDFGLNWLRLQNAATLPAIKDGIFGETEN